MDGESSRNDALFLTRVGDQPLGQLGGFAGRHDPANHVAAEDVQDDVEVEVGPLGRPQQLRYIPCPALIGTRASSSGFLYCE